jgi:hypothetical protein
MYQLLLWIHPDIMDWKNLKIWERKTITYISAPLEKKTHFIYIKTNSQQTTSLHMYMSYISIEKGFSQWVTRSVDLQLFNLNREWRVAHFYLANISFFT